MKWLRDLIRRLFGLRPPEPPIPVPDLSDTLTQLNGLINVHPGERVEPSEPWCGSEGGGALTNTPPAIPPVTPWPAPGEAIDYWALVRGEQVGSGGQGSVSLLRDRPDLVVKRFRGSSHGSIDAYRRLQDLSERVSVPGVEVVWPENPVCEHNRIVGYTMPRIGERFVVEVASQRKLAEFSLALANKGMFEPSRSPSPQQMMELLQLVALFVDQLHKHDFIYGDISHKNFLYALDPVGVQVLDVDTMRQLGQDNLVACRGAYTPDWKDPDERTSGFNTDRYRFALLVHRYLVARSLQALPSMDQEDPRIEGLNDVENAHVGSLLRRAAAGSGGRPTMAEWCMALGVRRYP